MQVNDRFEMPLNAMLLSATVITVSIIMRNTSGYLANLCCQIYGVIFIGSTTAFSAMVSAAVIFQQTSCVIPQAVLLYRGRERVLPERHFKLGRLGPAINTIAILWVLFLDVLYCLPVMKPVTPENMSYVSVVSIGLVIFVIALWFTSKRHVFTGPKVDFELMRQRRLDAIEGEIVAAELYSEGNRGPKKQGGH